MGSWSEHIDNITQNFMETFGDLSFEQLNWKPNSETWSIAQNMEHLMLINETYFAEIESIRKGTYQLPLSGKIGFLVSLFGKTVLNAVRADRKKKMKTFSIWEPAGSEISLDILHRFEDHQAKLKGVIRNSKDLLERGTIISSPVNKNIVYTLEKAFEIIVTHEKRHFEQANEIYQLIKEQ